jgi:DNA primase
MGRSKDSADRIRSEVPIIRVLYDYGYEVSPDGGDREQQFSCDLHGDGSDSKPSARVYPDTSSFHCFACGRSRDAITLVREKEGLDFWPAIKKIEADYGLSPLPWSGDEESGEVSRHKSVSDELRESKAESTKESADTKFKRLRSLVSNAYLERQVPPSVCADLWSLYDKAKHYQSQDSHQTQVLLGMLDSALEATFESLNQD